jgi:hypothetical protein
MNRQFSGITLLHENFPNISSLLHSGAEDISLRYDLYRGIQKKGA